MDRESAVAESESSSLMRAVRQDEAELAGQLVRAGVHPPRALRRAVLSGHCATLETMLEAGFPVAGSTAAAALVLAESRDESDCVTALRDAGLPADRSQRSLVGLVRRLVRFGDQEALAAASRQGFDFDVVDARRRSALVELVLRGDRGGVEALVAVGADLDLGDRAGVTALQYALWQGDEATAEFLLDAGADPSLRDRDGWDALAVAARVGAPAAVRRLLTAGVEPDSPTRQGWTALSLAIVDGHELVIDELLAAGADPLGGLPPAPTPLAWAVRGCRADLVARLASGRDVTPAVAARLILEAEGCAAAGAPLELGDLFAALGS